jgi:hypothetical protein
MKNGYTPRQYAYAVAIDALKEAFDDRFDELANLPESERQAARQAIIKLKNQLADRAKLDIV